jgi:hypothetical protein
MINTDELNSTLLQDLGLEGFPREVQDEVLGKLGENILRKITMSIMDKIPPAARQEFDSISEAGDSDRMKTFLDTHIPNFDGFVKDEVKKSVDEFKQIAAAL